MKNGLMLLMIGLGLGWGSIASTYAQAENGCTTLHADSDSDGVVYFIEPSTNNIVHEDVTPYRFVIEHSPDCRWLVGYAARYFEVLGNTENCEPGVIIWDASTGLRVQQFDSLCDTSLSSHPRLIWKPDSTALILSRWQHFPTIGSTSPRFLWYPHNNQMIDLSGDYNHRLTLIKVFWDDARQLIWSSGDAGVGAVSSVTGELVYWFPNVPTKSTFILSPDLSKVVAYGHYENRKYNNANMSVHDIASGESIELDVETNGLGTVAMSPDNRYVGMAYTAIRIWDLHNLGEERLPNQRFYFPDSDIAEWSFVDSTTIEATSEAGDVMRWNLVTGQPIDASP